MATIAVSNYTSRGNFSRFKLENVVLKSTILCIRREIARKVELPIQEVVLVYCGVCLEDDNTLESYGIAHGCTIHALHKKEKTDIAPEPMDNVRVQQLIIALRMALMNPAFYNTLNQLSKPEVLENIISATPGLAEDPVAIAMLQDPELLIQAADPNSIHRLVEAHPALVEAVSHIAAAVHEEQVQQMSPNIQSSSAYSYSIDGMSDEDDVDFAQVSASISQGITSAQLASALAAASSSLNQSADDSGANPNAIPGQLSITDDMFRQVMQQVMTANKSGSQGDRESQLLQLRDMGITDDELSRQALEATNGDVQAALKLIFGDEI